MKSTLAFAVLAIVACVDGSVVRVNPRANLNVGYLAPGDRLLHRYEELWYKESYVYQPAIYNAVQYQDVVYRGNVTNRITAIQASEVGATQWATAYIVQGGVAQSNVTVRFTSARGYGYYYLLDVWGR